ncbi:hypothetical protein HanXRQr2_Chr13g0608041 [Helianthus annuus]|uniref:Uncharacterized protein n=1 Tax=Helianthus annuus TaxID=4232 RepID=A0A9K3EJV4_HELAN|nr:hypothetical protein HanXRQr2_Chr13g0608041 [Helianthus annuus]KAJ0850906.1 hypothetical protein HanPSC8_Chr13g0586261 [Helianthus annuus]
MVGGSELEDWFLIFLSFLILTTCCQAGNQQTIFTVVGLGSRATHLVGFLS